MSESVLSILYNQYYKNVRYQMHFIVSILFVHLIHHISHIVRSLLNVIHTENLKLLNEMYIHIIQKYRIK